MTYKANEKARDGSVPSSKQLQFGVVWELAVIQTLCIGTSIEADVGHHNTEPGHQTCNSSHVGEPAKHLSQTSTGAHECKECESGQA